MLAPGPTVRIKDPTEERHEGLVVVGVDGSCGGRRALTWALREALVLGVPVRVVTVWQWQLLSRLPAGAPGRVSEARRARQEQDLQLTDVLAAFGRPVPPLMTELQYGDPASRLLERSADADLLVLGCRGCCDGTDPAGHRARPEPLGPVARVCTRYARCPVVVVPAES